MDYKLYYTGNNTLTEYNYFIDGSFLDKGTGSRVTRPVNVVTESYSGGSIPVTQEAGVRPLAVMSNLGVYMTGSGTQASPYVITDYYYQ